MSGVYRILIFSGSDYIHTARAPPRLAVPGGVHTASDGLLSFFDFIELSFCSTYEATTAHRRDVSVESVLSLGIDTAPEAPVSAGMGVRTAFGRSNFQISASVDAAILQYFTAPESGPNNKT